MAEKKTDKKKTILEEDSSELKEFIIIFKDGALDKLKELAYYFNIPQHKLGDVLIKGLHLLDLAKSEGKTEMTLEHKKQKIKIDLEKL